MLHPHGAELMAQVGNHAAGHLMQVLRLIVFALDADWMALALGDLGEMLFDRLDRCQIDQRAIAERPGILCDVKNRGLRRTVGQRRNRRVQRIHAELDCFEIVERRHAVVAVSMELQRYLADVFLNQRNQALRPIRREQTGDVLEANPVGPDRRRPTCPLGVIFIAMTRRDRVDDVDDHVHPEPLQLVDLDGGGVIVVPWIGRTRERNAVRDHPLDHQQPDRSWNLFESRSETAMIAEPRAAKFFRS
jgi:hypothetical protein